LAIFSDSDFTDSLARTLSESGLPRVKGIDWLATLQQGVRDVLRSTNPKVIGYLKSLSDSYTLLAFLKNTPDVQSAVQKMFSQAELWLDTTVLLPILAETIANDPPLEKPYTALFESALSAGNRLYITPGVIEELDSHISKSLLCSRTPHGQWRGPIPYLLKAYINSGESLSDFASWAETFRGDHDPRNDIIEYLAEVLSIAVSSLDDESTAGSPELRNALQAIWFKRHKELQNRGFTELDDTTASRLISNDITCFTGVVHKRTQQGSSPYGFNAWWVTIDRKAFSLDEALRAHLSCPPPSSPVMGLDFLANYLSFGPSRNRVRSSSGSPLPVMGLLSGVAQLTPELIEEAEQVRSTLKDLPDRIIRRRIRDHLNIARATIGPMSSGSEASRSDEE